MNVTELHLIMVSKRQGRGRQRPPKMPNVLKVVSECIAAGRYLDTRHGSDRQSERLITRLEIIDGKLRVIVAFDEETNTVIVTAIGLEGG
jgi:hypothetical protein